MPVTKVTTLDPNFVMMTYKRLLHVKGFTSCAYVARELANMGIRTRTGRGPTRQGVHWQLKRTQEGRDLLAITKNRIGRP